MLFFIKHKNFKRFLCFSFAIQCLITTFVIYIILIFLSNSNHIYSVYD